MVGPGAGHGSVAARHAVGDVDACGGQGSKRSVHARSMAIWRSGSLSLWTELLVVSRFGGSAVLDIKSRHALPFGE
jgi:hypothetical protein